jgi:hypothetical protein
MRCLVLAPVAGVLALAACAAPGAPLGVPDAATVLRDAQAAKINDLTFSGSGTFASSLGGLLGGGTGGGTDTSVQAYIAGKITMKPQRADLSLASAQGQAAFAEIITDTATETGYVNLPILAQAGLGGAGWIAVPLDGLGSYLDTSIFTNFEHVTNPAMVGAEVLNGTQVYHLRGEQQLPQGLGSATEDFYVRRDNSFPVRVIIQGSVSAPSSVTGGTGSGSTTVASEKATIDFTGVNTGITISLPSGAQTA